MVCLYEGSNFIYFFENANASLYMSSESSQRGTGVQEILHEAFPCFPLALQLDGTMFCLMTDKKSHFWDPEERNYTNNRYYWSSLLTKETSAICTHCEMTSHPSLSPTEGLLGLWNIQYQNWGRLVILNITSFQGVWWKRALWAHLHILWYIR